MNLLILGGTSEASALSRALAGDSRFRATISLAGRTRNPAPQPLPVRSGGFGGVDGLARYIVEHRIDALVDATHPFAAQMSRNAALAARQTATAALVIQRPAWQRQPGDRWIEVADLPAAAQALGPVARRVLLTIGQKDLQPFAAAPQHHYLLRSVDAPPPASLPPHAEVITARGPFVLADELDLLRGRQIEMLVTKNSGGTATEAKLTAARMLRLPVIMVARPVPPAAETVASVHEALAWLEHRHAALHRGV
jgi:precorrin-6A/cobalt-precorrin-6A reductase